MPRMLPVHRESRRSVQARTSFLRHILDEEFRSSKLDFVVQLSSFEETHQCPLEADACVLDRLLRLARHYDAHCLASRDASRDLCNARLPFWCFEEDTFLCSARGRNLSLGYQLRAALNHTVRFRSVVCCSPLCICRSLFLHRRSPVDRFELHGERAILSRQRTL